MIRCKFLFDEFLPRSIRRGLSRRSANADVARVGDESAPPIGTSDAELLVFCEEAERLLVTADRATMPREIQVHQTAGHQTYGVLIVRPGSSLLQVLDELQLVYEASEPGEWINVCEYIPF